ncbi:hypothetical protein ACFWAR_13330 [Streptomyces sp. NPDC059917]|uniref:hypothetical protein n=1 Tax=Streptomyces sp. NPDC059917 TaxID=3347002 RepID=UPI003652C810
MTKTVLSMGSKIAGSLLPKKTASAGCAPTCWQQPKCGERNQCGYIECCYTASCGYKCSV